MFRGHFIFRFVAFVVLIGILIGGGALVFRAGESQGYALGLAASGKELTAPGAVPAPGMLPGTPYYGYGFYRPVFFPFFAPFGFLGGGLFLLFFFFVISGFFRLLFWGRAGMWRGGPGHHGTWGGPTPPWANQPGDPKAAPQGEANPGQTGQPKA